MDDQRASQPLRLRGAITELVGLGEDTTQVSAEVQHRSVAGTGPGDPRAACRNSSLSTRYRERPSPIGTLTARELTVTFIEPVQNTARFTVNGELRLPRAGKLDVPLMRLPAAERETGGVAVEVLGAGEIKDRQAIGLDEAEACRVGPTDFEPAIAFANRLSPATGGWKIAANAFAQRGALHAAGCAHREYRRS